MKKTKLLPVAVLASLLSAFIPVSQAQMDPTQTRSFWDDPDFKNRFMGTYGQLSDVEPKVSREEGAFLQSVVPVIRDNPRQAITELQNANSDGATAVYDFAIGNIYFQEGDLNNARTNYLAAVKKHPDFRRVHKNLGLLEVREGNLDAAIKHLSKSAELGDMDSRTFGLLGYAYLQQGKFVPSESAYRQAVLQDPDKLDWKLGIAQTLITQERYDEAIALFSQLIEANPDRSDFWLLQTNAYLGSNQPLKAAENLELVRRLGSLDSASFVLLGDIYLNQQMPDLALNAYQEVISREDKPDIKAPLRSASILAQINAFDESQKLIDTIQTNYTSELTKPDRLKLLNLEAKIAKQQNKVDRSAEILEEIIEEDPLNGEALIQLAEYHVDKDEVEKAQFIFERAQNIEGFEAQALLSHAQLMVKNSDYVEAVNLLNRSLAIKPSKAVEDYRDRVERAARSLR
ncbi:tetratricopeptide repeat protein [Rubellicoccus peritrichatus]|uniref:Tetratricopeptide repeat protein n=1 Tax=Rubellicoccus peritrichatus TaxID=3080537 RepID=A0AAQ3LBD7_9BACT|nr:tetratricopeptide repeat protein [Puniceicoccus sp. CR14]WOO42740.1 tetratricopeptide repeat protein [Puniceicoccus sp. CR14]